MGRAQTATDRERRARQLLQQHLDGPPSERWVRGRRHGDGKPFFAIPGSLPRKVSEPRPIYEVTTYSCSCPDREFNRDEQGHQVTCAHILAVRLWLDRYKAGLIQIAPRPKVAPARPSREADVEPDWRAYDHQLRSGGPVTFTRPSYADLFPPEE